jgi:hypothetical protein
MNHNKTVIDSKIKYCSRSFLHCPIRDTKIRDRVPQNSIWFLCPICNYMLFSLLVVLSILPWGLNLFRILSGWRGFASKGNSRFLYLRNRTAISKLTQERLITDHHFGIHVNPDSVCFSQQLVDGTSMFACRYKDAFSFNRPVASKQTAVSGGKKNSNQIPTTLPFIESISSLDSWQSQPHHIYLTLATAVQFHAI